MSHIIKAKPKASKKREVQPPFPLHGHACLNCGRDISGSYCSACGQSAKTHRLSVAHFLLHDMVHSLWHLDRGIFFTLREVLIRPGYGALDYIRGRRAGKFPIVTLLLLLLGTIFWLNSFDHPAVTHNITTASNLAPMMDWLNAFVQDNKKWILLGLVPVSSLSTLIVFRRTRLNYTEHLVVNSYVFGGLLVALILIKLVWLAFPATIAYTGGWVDLFGFIFYMTGYWQAYHKAYTAAGILWRYVALFFLGILLFVLAAAFSLLIAAAVFHVPGSDRILDQAVHNANPN